MVLKWLKQSRMKVASGLPSVTSMNRNEAEKVTQLQTWAISYGKRICQRENHRTIYLNELGSYSQVELWPNHETSALGTGRPDICSVGFQNCYGTVMDMCLFFSLPFELEYLLQLFFSFVPIVCVYVCVCWVGEGVHIIFHLGYRSLDQETEKLHTKSLSHIWTWHRRLEVLDLNMVPQFGMRHLEVLEQGEHIVTWCGSVNNLWPEDSLC